MTENSFGTVIKPHKASYSDPLKARAGDVLHRGPEKHSEWPGWIWCLDRTGKGGWIPESYLEETPEGLRLARDLDGTELTVEVGQKLTIIEEICGWVVCKTETGERGAVPKENVRTRE